uniref:Uncharacterized protein n=1 Tax=Panagrolaimus sp. PS1159 TaxID=55785 RepID=A0AC35GW22_9BILA
MVSFNDLMAIASNFLPKNSSKIITTSTAEELFKIPHFLSLDKFGMFEIPETFDIKSFYDHIKVNEKTKIDLDFSRQISNEYKTQLQTIVYEIIETEYLGYKMTRIDFSGMTNDSREKMFDLYGHT